MGIIGLYFFIFCVTLFGFVLRAIINQSLAVQILYGIWLIAFIIILTIMTISFFLIGIILFYKIKRIFKVNEDIKFGQLKFTKIMMAIDLFVLTMIIYLLFFTIIQFTELDIFGYHVLFLSDIFLYLWLLVYNILTFLILFDMKRIKFIIRKCRGQQDE